LARTLLNISDSALRLTLEVMLKAEGHEIVTDNAEVTIADTPAAAVNALAASQVLLLSPVSGIAEAVSAMQQGVYGYILLPLQPGEAGLMVTRAASKNNRIPEDNEAESPMTPLAEVERKHIETVLRACKGNQVKAARVLGIGRNTLWRKMKSWNKKEPPLL